MYKLLTTAAVIMTVATPTFAWTNAQELIEGLNDVYTGVDGAGTGGSGHFESLQSNALGDFIGETNLGVTHVTLTVVTPAEAAADLTGNTIANTIVAGVEGGTTLSNIQDAQTNLINQVNYDLFVDGDTGSVEDYDSADGYDPVTDLPKNPGGTPITSVDNDGTVNWANANSGLVGVKVGKIVAEANAINDYLTSGDYDGSTTEFTDAFAAKTGVYGSANLSVLFGHIEGADGTGGINSSIAAANNAGGGFFGNVDDQQGDNAVDGTTISNFQVKGFTVADGKIIGAEPYDSLLLWAQAQP